MTGQYWMKVLIGLSVVAFPRARESIAEAKQPAAETQGNSETPNVLKQQDRAAITSIARIRDERVQLEFHKVDLHGQSRIVFKQIESVRTGLRLDLSGSLLFQVGIQNLREADSASRPTYIPSETMTVSAPSENVTLRRSGDTVNIRFSQIPIPESRQRLEVSIRVVLQGPGRGTMWTGSARLTGEGAYSIVRFRFPYLRVGTIGTEGVDDHVAFPMTGGLLLNDPIRRGRAQRALEDSTMFNYPGYVESSFIAYYDNDAENGDAERGGLYLRSSDVYAFVKSFFFKPSADSRALDLYIQHYNYAPDPFVTRTDMSQAWESLQSIGVGQELPYVTFVELFEGDWVDAADNYRRGLQNSSESTEIQFLSRSTLARRSDIPPQIRSSAYNAAYVLAGGTDPIPDNGADLRAIRDTLAFFDQEDGSPLTVNMTFVGDITARAQDVSISNDMGAFDIRPGFVDFLWNLRNTSWSRPLASIALNCDMGNWESSRAQNEDLMLHDGLIALGNGEPLTLTGHTDPRFAPTPGAVKGISCGGSPLVYEMRLNSVENILRPFVRNGRTVVSNLEFSGRGTEAGVCYRPLHELNAEHHHTIGGGRYWMFRYRNMIRELKELYQPIGLRLLPVAERAHEHLIDTSQLSGRSGVAPWDLSFHGPANWVENAQPVPIRSYLYHDYALLVARIPRLSNVVRLYVDAHRAAGRELNWTELIADEAFMTLQRQRIAEWTVQGHQLGMSIQGPGQRDPLRMIDGPPGSVPVDIESYHTFLRQMIRLRRFAADYLIDGQMLRPPDFDPRTTMTDLLVATRGGLESVTIPAVCASAWRSPRGTIALVLVNFAGRDATARLRWDATSWNIRPNRIVILRRLNEKRTSQTVIHAIATGNGRLSADIRLPLADRVAVFAIE